METNSAINEAASAIENTDALIITAGAGMGVDSGLPDFRGNEGLWRAYPRLKSLGLSFEAAANPGWFDKNPSMAWAFYGHRQRLYRDTKPHHGFTLLKKWGEGMDAGYFVYTSNVDGHFEFAGFDDQRLLECHGNIHRHQCREPCHYELWTRFPKDMGINLDSLEASGSLPRCPECHLIARPNVLMFQDWDWIRDVVEDQEHRFRHWIESLNHLAARVLIIEIGAGSGLPQVRRQSESLMERLDAGLVRINLREANGPLGCVSIPLSALDALKRIDETMNR